MSQTRKMMSLLLKIKTPSKPTKKDSSCSDDSSSSDEEESAPKKSKKAAPAEPMEENEPVIKAKEDRVTVLERLEEAENLRRSKRLLQKPKKKYYDD